MRLVTRHVRSPSRQNVSFCRSLACVPAWLCNVLIMTPRRCASTDEVSGGEVEVASRNCRVTSMDIGQPPLESGHMSTGSQKDT